eukprot:m51a1_g1607 putative f-box lrr-repeat protein 15 (331) ;mRNA; f:192142-193360
MDRLRASGPAHSLQDLSARVLAARAHGLPAAGTLPEDVVRILLSAACDTFEPRGSCGFSDPDAPDACTCAQDSAAAAVLTSLLVPHLRELDLGPLDWRVAHLGPDFFDRVASSCTALSSLAVHCHPRLKDTDAYALLKRLPLQRLSLRSCSALTELCPVVIACRPGALDLSCNLVELDLEGCKRFEGETLGVLATQCMRGLRVLNLKGCSFVQPAPLVAAIRTAGANLESLNVADCASLTDAVLDCIAEHCPNLSELNASWCELLTDKGVQNVCEHCTSLASLKLRACTSVSGLSVRTAARRLRGRLLRLDVSRCDSVSSEDVSELVEYF